MYKNINISTTKHTIIILCTCYTFQNIYRKLYCLSFETMNLHSQCYYSTFFFFVFRMYIVKHLNLVKLQQVPT